MSETDCRLCGGSCFQIAHLNTKPEGETDFGIANYDRRLVRCRDCDVFLNRHSMLGDEFYADAYRQSTYTSGVEGAYHKIMNLPPGRSDNQARVARLLPYLNSDSRVLDVGSGLCVFLAALEGRVGYRVAVEQDPVYCRHAAECVAVDKAWSGPLEELRERFDLVALNKVLEHVGDPVALLKEAASRVAPGGHLYLEVPDGRAAADSGGVVNREEFFVEHLFVFTPRSLEWLLGAAGLRVVEMNSIHEPSDKYTLYAVVKLRVLVDRAEQLSALESGDRVVAYNGQACWALDRAGRSFEPLGELVDSAGLTQLDAELVERCREFCQTLEGTLHHPFVEAGYQVYKAVCGWATRWYYLKRLREVTELTLFETDRWKPFSEDLSLRWRATPPPRGLPPLPPKKWLAPPLNFLWRRFHRARGYEVGGQLVFADRHPYEWEPLIQDLRGRHCWAVTGAGLTRLRPRRSWPLVGERVPALPLPPELPPLETDGFDLRPILREWLPTLLRELPSQERRCHKLLDLLERVPKPRLLCYDSMPTFRHRRLARLAGERGWTSVAFQHGGSYGTHRVPSHHLMEIGSADVFLSYGPGIEFETCTRVLAVGPSRVPPRPPRATGADVLYLGEYSSGNEDSGLFLTEDTRRYRQQAQLLGQLRRQGHRVTYRPFPGGLEEQAIPWFCQGHGIAVDRNTSLTRLLRHHRLVIADSSSGTVWNEVMLQGRPLILLLQPGQPGLTPEFEKVVREACYLCHTPEQVLEVLADGPAVKTGREKFLEHYYQVAGQVERLNQTLGGLFE